MERPPIDRGRRKALGALSAAGLASLLPRLSLSDASAATTSNEYRALVCVVLSGGNDSNNTIIPFTTPGYATYAQARGGSSPDGLVLPQADLLPIADVNNNVRYAFHPAITGLRDLWAQGNLAMLFNVGMLLKPGTKANYKTVAAAPPNLYSHEDQQRLSQGQRLRSVATPSGWGGRMADVLGNAGGALPVSVSLNGNVLLLKGESTSMIAVPPTGTLAIDGFTSGAADQARLSALQQLNASGSDAVMVSTLGGLNTSAFSLTQTLNPILAGTSSVRSVFGNKVTGLTNQLIQVAKLIEHRADLGNPMRQIFYVFQSGYDTHVNQLATHNQLLGDLSLALKGFFDATVALGVASNVTTFTLSEFSRTLRPSGGGSDHGYGGHHMIMGGAVKGQATYGTFPSLTINGPDDIFADGRFLPTLSFDQYGATLAKWMGVQPNEMAGIFPYLANFATKDLGFLNA